MITEAATIDLNTGTRDRKPRHEKKPPLTETGWLLVAMPCILLAGIGIGLLAWLLSSDGLNMHVLSIRLLSDLIDYLLVVAFIAVATLIAVRQVRRMVAVDTAQTVRAIIREEIQTLLAEPGEKIAGDLGRIKDRLYLRGDDDPTEPLRRPSPVPQHTVGIASVYGGRMDVALDRVAERLVDQLGKRFDEFGNQRWFAGYASGREDTDGSVVALQPRNGHRSN